MSYKKTEYGSTAIRYYADLDCYYITVSGDRDIECMALSACEFRDLTKAISKHNEDRD